MTPARLRELLDRGTQGVWKTAGATHVFAPGPNGANVCTCGEPRASTSVGYTPVELGSAGLYEAAANADKIAGLNNVAEALVALWAAERDRAICASSLPTFTDPNARAACQRDIDACDRRVASALAALEKADG